MWARSVPLVMALAICGVETETSAESHRDGICPAWCDAKFEKRETCCAEGQNSISLGKPVLTKPRSKAATRLLVKSFIQDYYEDFELWPVLPNSPYSDSHQKNDAVMTDDFFDADLDADNAADLSCHTYFQTVCTACFNFEGTYSDSGGGTVSITQSGCRVTATNQLQRWSPASGIVSGSTIAMLSLIGTLSGSAISWSNGHSWTIRNP